MNNVELEMREIGVFICNYNKAEMVVKCVRAVQNQSFRDVDIYVVDNASEDHSVQLLKDTYGETVTILQNEKNLGGSGGFARGIRTALEKDYKYFMLVDNDAFLEQDAIKWLHEYIDSHIDVGICGAETLYLQEPSKIQDLGGKIDYDNYQWGGITGGLMELPGERGVIVECDYVASCALIARTSAVREFGGFPEENFIYWDDIEWCTKCWKSGYKVVVNGNAKALHDMSKAGKENMFLNYYANRNRYKFFTKYLPETKLDDFFQKITSDCFRTNYAAVRKGMKGALTFFNALDDFMNGVTGQALQGRIVPFQNAEDRLLPWVMKAHKLQVFMPDKNAQNYQALSSILRYLKNHNENLEIMVVSKLLPLEEFDMTLRICEHVTAIKENVLPIIYIDLWKNIVLAEEDYEYYHSYEKKLHEFQEHYRPLFWERVKELRG